MPKKTSIAALRAARAQIRKAREEGEIEQPTPKKIVYAEGVETPSKKRTLKRSARVQVRANGGGIKRVRSYPFGEGDLVQIHKVPWAARGARKGDIGMVLEVMGGQRFFIQVGAQTAWVNGSDLRPLPKMEEDDEYRDRHQ